MASVEQYYDGAAYRPHQRRGCISSASEAIFWIVLLGAFVLTALSVGPDLLVSYGVVSPETMRGVLHVAQPEERAPTPPPPGRPQPPIQAPIAHPPGQLPPCSAVHDTTTACEQDQVPTSVPEPTPMSGAVWTTPCETPPGERPCWLPADQPWEPPASVPETPIVLLPPTDAPPLVLSDSACAAWHPPLPYPEECDHE